MKDDFLFDNLPPVSEVFSKRLWLTLERQAQNQKERQMVEKTLQTQRNRLRNGIVFLFLFLVFAVSVTPLRVKAWELIQNVGNYLFSEHPENPDGALFSGEGESAEPILQNGDVDSYPVATQAPQNAWEHSAFDFTFPTWIPDGFVLNPISEMASSGSWVHFIWENAESAEISFLAEKTFADQMLDISIGENSGETVEIHDRPALLIRGAWNSRHIWDLSLGLTLFWEDADVQYRLIYNEREAEHNAICSVQADTEKIAAELIRMAESAE